MPKDAPFPHIATLNLFRESDNSLEITVCSADAETLLDTPDGLKPIDHIENLIISAALRMKARKETDGTFRQI